MSQHTSTGFSFENPNPVPTPPVNPYTQRNLQMERIEQNTDFAIPAGAYRVKIENAGEIGASLLAIALVNGQELDVRATPIEFEAFTDEATQETLLSPAYTIVTNGAMIFATIYK